MALDDLVNSLAATAEARRKHRLAERARAVFQRRTILAYRRLLLDDDGDFRPDALKVLGDLSAVAKMGIADADALTEAELRTRAGRRSLVLHIFARLDLSGEKLRKLAKSIRENDDE